MGIAVLGLNGAGKSTLAHALAKELGLFEIDGEDYYFPGQQEDRLWAMEHQGRGLAQNQKEMPFSHPVGKEAAAAALRKDVETHSDFVLSCVRLNWGQWLLAHISLAAVLDTPSEERQRRLQSREERRFGARVLPGGDMASQQEEFRAQSALRREDLVEESLRELACPILRLDGTRPVQENIAVIRRFLHEQHG